MAEPTDCEVRAADGWNAPTKNLPPIEPRDLPERVTLDVRGSPLDHHLPGAHVSGAGGALYSSVI
jgi:hypothetical protein